MGAEGGREHRRQRRDRAIHQADEAGLHDLQDEAAPGVVILLALALPRGKRLASISRRGALVLQFGGGQIAQQFADRGVASLA